MAIMTSTQQKLSTRRRDCAALSHAHVHLSPETQHSRLRKAIGYCHRCSYAGSSRAQVQAQNLSLEEEMMIKIEVQWQVHHS